MNDNKSVLRAVFFALILTAVAAALLKVPVEAASGPKKLMVIPDASGSMWGKVEGKTKIEIARDAWIGIVPSDIPHGKEAINDRHDLTYKRISQRTSGIMEFRAPGKPGSYDFRMHDTDNNGTEVASVTFTVK
ncbi:MAG: hypothetical protein GY940_36725 [bacterium]|nr:hypothetical protein [bacterium]